MKEAWNMSQNPVDYWAGRESGSGGYKQYPAEAIQWQKNTERWKDFENELSENRTLQSKLLNEAPNGLPLNIRVTQEKLQLTQYTMHMLMRLWMNRTEEHDPRAPEAIDLKDWQQLPQELRTKDKAKVEAMLAEVIQYMEENNLPVWRDPQDPEVYPPNWEYFEEEARIDGNERYLI